MATTLRHQQEDPVHGRAVSPGHVRAQKLPGIAHVIAVGSGKGGVGKTTVSVNLAVALGQVGHAVGLVDADVLGPSVPGMLGLDISQPPLITADQQLVPADRHGIQTISMAMLTGDDQPAILRGPMVSKYLNLFIGTVAWGALDYLILDLPPGTGDTQLTLAQSVPLSGAIIVTTPQDVSLKIARRGLRMFQTVHVPILGIIENMSTFTCPHCGQDTDVFRHGGGQRMSRELEVPFLGRIPLYPEIATGGDEGRPIVASDPGSLAAQAYRAIAAELLAQVRQLPAAALGAFVWSWDTGQGQPAWVETATRPTGSPTHAIGFRRRDARTLSVLWEDGRKTDFDVRDLRLACRCALCLEEMSGRPLLDPKSVPLDVTPRFITSVGNYAITLHWSDGHDTGIYSFKYLRQLGEREATGAVEDV
jgi:ATP-binding protein involved in chromosome partitioning